MNPLTKSLAAFALLTGTLASLTPVQALPAVLLPSPAPAQSALMALLADPSAPLPAGTKLLSVRVAEGLATVSFSRELRDNFTGGDSAEMRAVNSVLRTLGQFPTVSRVQILVDGQTIDSLGGLLILSNPLPVIRPAAQNAPRQTQWLHRNTSAIRQSRQAKKHLMPTADAR